MELTYKSACKNFQFKQADNNDFIEIEGLASTFGNRDRDGDIIVKGAFANTLINRETPIKFLKQHDLREVIGTIDQAIETDEGLFVKGRMPKANSVVKDLFPLLEMGALRDFSIGFKITESDITPDGTQLIKELQLFEISIVSIPANSKAKITSVKSDEEIINLETIEKIATKRELEQLLINTKCFSRKASVTLASRLSCVNDNDQKRDSIDSKTGQSDSVNLTTEQSDSVINKKVVDEFNKLTQLFK